MRAAPHHRDPACLGLGEARTRSGFTLIEILAVILIVGILATILITQLGGAEESARIQNTRRRLAMLEVVIDTYANEFGDAPLSTFLAEQGVPNEGTNVGVEALVVSLWSRGWEAGELSDMADELVNVDGDVSELSLTDFATKALLEIPDDWGNPIAYLHRRSYAGREQVYLTLDVVTGEEILSSPVALKNAATGRFYRNASYQLISAGPDARFGTADDIANFERDTSEGS